MSKGKKLITVVRCGKKSAISGEGLRGRSQRKVFLSQHSPFLEEFRRRGASDAGRNLHAVL